MAEIITLISLFGFAYMLGLATGVYYLKNKMLNSIDSNDLNPEEMLGEAEDMMGEVMGNIEKEEDRDNSKEENQEENQKDGNGLYDF